MRQHGCRVIPNDQESGYTVCSEADLLAIHERTLCKSWYVPVSPEDWCESLMLREYCVLCKRVSEIDGALCLDTNLTTFLDSHLTMPTN